MNASIIHIAIRTKDYEKSLDFYCNKLGFKFLYSLYKDDKSLWLTYLKNENGQFIELFPEPDMEISKNGSFFHFCLLVDDIEKAAHELQEKGVELWNGPSFLQDKTQIPYVATAAKCGSYAFFIDDPDGNSIEVMQYTSESMQINIKE